jgi:parallel beta-helix repeat protein
MSGKGGLFVFAVVFVMVGLVFCGVFFHLLTGGGVALEVVALRQEGAGFWTVDDDGVADFRTIQEAIDNATQGDTIYVYNGTYYENVVVNKSVTLVGENRLSTVIDGNYTGNVMNITASYVNVTGFTIQNSGNASNCGIYVSGSSVNNNISFNIITKNYCGIKLSGSSNSISRNDIIDNYIDGIMLYYFSNNNTIYRNNITNSSFGIELWSNSYNSIRENNITNNEKGVILEFSSNNIFFKNNIVNGTYGVWLDQFSSNNTFSENNIEQNSYGIRIFSSSNNSIYHNNFVSNTRQIFSSNSMNSWDNGAEGNYWSDYAGADLDPDGIGDSPYVIDVNNTDNDPLMGIFFNFNATFEHQIQTICNSTISNFQFSDITISFNVSGENGTAGFCRIRIPIALMNATYHVFVNGTEVSYITLPISNSTHSYLYFTYSHSTQEVIIIPELPHALLLFLLTTTLLAILVHKRSLQNNIL